MLGWATIGRFWANFGLLIVLFWKMGFKIYWIFWIPQALINILRIWSSKFSFDFKYVYFRSKIDSYPSNFIKIKILFLKCSSRQYGTRFFNFTFVHLKIFAINVPLFCYFSVHFSDKFVIKSSKTIVYLNTCRAHFFLSEYIFFYFLQFDILGIFNFKVFDFIEKMNENVTLNSNISKTIQDKKKDVF